MVREETTPSRSRANRIAAVGFLLIIIGMSGPLLLHRSSIVHTTQRHMGTFHATTSESYLDDPSMWKEEEGGGSVISASVSEFASETGFESRVGSDGSDGRNRLLDQTYSDPSARVDAGRLYDESDKTDRRPPPSPSPSPRSKRKVYIFAKKTHEGREGESQHFIRDGVDRSGLLELTSDPLDGGGVSGVVWLVDFIRNHCDDLVPLAGKWRTLAAATNGNVSSSSLPPPPTVILIDFRDAWSLYPQILACATDLSLVLGKENVHYATRVNQVGRNLNHDDNYALTREDRPFGPLGNIIDYANLTISNCTGGKVRILRYGVRTDQVQWIESYLTELRRVEANATLTEGNSSMAMEGAAGTSSPAQLSDPTYLPRTGDVAHFWKVGEDKRNGWHRDVVTIALRTFAQHPHNRLVFLDTAGRRWMYGRNSVQHEYVRILLSSKIVVTSQRDKWEDHFRLMECLAAGALCLTDPMHSLPAFLKDGVSLVVFRSIAQLKERVTYYLCPENEEERINIAREGHRIAMRYHRSWHWIERLVFGNWSTSDGI